MDLTNLKYVQVPMVVLLDKDISSTAKILMGLITTLSMKDGYCYARFSCKNKTSKSLLKTITSSITALRRKNYVRVANEDFERKIYLANIF